jgi:hypothetical protein
MFNINNVIVFELDIKNLDRNLKKDEENLKNSEFFPLFLNIS